MVVINASRQLSAPVEKAWEIIGDVDNEPTYWHGTKSVRNISRNGNVIERDVTIAFRDSRCRQTVILDPKKSVTINITEGPFKGTKKVTLIPVGDKTRVEVAWDIKLAGFLGIFSGMVKKHIAEGTEEALERIAKAVE
ncbi:MAG: type II toxin-antitoxin system RatA family toxin [Nitrososphaera sp.]